MWFYCVVLFSLGNGYFQTIYTFNLYTGTENLLGEKLTEKYVNLVNNKFS
jgi:hypothetical protein